MSAEIGRRLLQAREILKLSQEEMGRLGGVSKRTYCYYESGERDPTQWFVRSLALGGVNPIWLLSGSGEALLSSRASAARAADMVGDVLFGDASARMRRERDFREIADRLKSGLHGTVHDHAPEPRQFEGLVMVPHLGLEASAGPGRYAVVSDKAGELAFRLDFLRRVGIIPRNAGLATVRGESMLEKLHDGDIVLLDRADREIRSGRCYVLRHHDEIIIKYLSRLPDGRILVTSENAKAFPPFTIVPDELGTNIEIIGRVKADTHEWD